MTKMKTKKNKIMSAEFFFALSYFLSSLIKPLLISNASRSSTILLGSTILLILFSVFASRFLISKRKCKIFLIIVFVVSAFFVWDMIFRPNNLLGQYYYNFIIYGIIPLVMLLEVEDFEQVLYWWSFWAIIVGIMYIADPLLGYQWMGGYMPYGFEAMLPAFSGACVIFFYYKKKCIMPLMILFFAEIVIFANKGAIITGAAVMIFTYLYSNNKQNVSWKKLWGVCSGIIVCFWQKNNILHFFIMLAKKIGIRSYSLITIEESFNLQGGEFFIGRSNLWSNVWEYCKQHIFTGYGIGWMEEITGNYAHNFFLDLISTFGIILSFFILIFLIVLLKKTIYNSNAFFKYFLLLIFLLWFFPLQFSLTIWKTEAFWVFVGANLYMNNKCNFNVAKGD